MSVSPPRPLPDEERAQMRRWLDIWREAGPLLEEERWRRVAALTDDDAWRMAQDLLMGPLALGHSSHFGLGLFVPASRA